MANVEVHRPFENGESSTIINPNNQECIIILPYAQSIKVVSSGYISTNIHYFPVYMVSFKTKQTKTTKIAGEIRFHAEMPLEWIFSQDKCPVPPSSTFKRQRPEATGGSWVENQPTLHVQEILM